jgi:hypothetical protein
MILEGEDELASIVGVGPVSACDVVVAAVLSGTCDTCLDRPGDVSVESGRGIAAGRSDRRFSEVDRALSADVGSAAFGSVTGSAASVLPLSTVCKDSVEGFSSCAAPDGAALTEAGWLFSPSGTVGDASGSAFSVLSVLSAV